MQLPKRDKLERSRWTVHTEPSPVFIRSIIPHTRDSLPPYRLSSVRLTRFGPVSRSALRLIARTRELVFPGLKSRSASFKHLVHLPYFVHLIIMMHRFVETNYNLDLGPAQVTQLNKAISNGADKGTFFLPKGMRMAASAGPLLIPSEQASPDALSSLQRLSSRTMQTPRR